MKNQDMLARMICTFVFTLFSFCYLYDYQADLLTVMQHVFSKGQTHYNHFIGAVLITVMMLIINVGVVRLCRKIRIATALTFVPSAIFLAMLTNVRISYTDNELVFGAWRYIGVLLIVLFAVCVWLANKSGFVEALTKSVMQPIRGLWVNLLMMTVILLVICFVGNSNKVYHARIHAEQCLMDKDYTGALKAISRCNTTDSCLTMLTAYTLSRKGELADRLFEFRLLGGSSALMPNGRGLKFELYPERDFYLYLGGYFRQKMSAKQYISYRLRHGKIEKPMADYILCSFLLERNIDAFAANIGKYYSVSDSAALPRHYREALTLYTHLRSNPSVIYSSDVMNADFQDYQNMQKAYSNEQERMTALRDTYGNTYWFYYDY